MRKFQGANFSRDQIIFKLKRESRCSFKLSLFEVWFMGSAALTYPESRLEIQNLSSHPLLLWPPESECPHFIKTSRWYYNSRQCVLSSLNRILWESGLRDEGFTYLERQALILEVRVLASQQCDPTACRDHTEEEEASAGNGAGRTNLLWHSRLPGDLWDAHRV